MGSSSSIALDHLSICLDALVCRTRPIRLRVIYDGYELALVIDFGLDAGPPHWTFGGPYTSAGRLIRARANYSNNVSRCSCL